MRKQSDGEAVPAPGVAGQTWHQTSLVQPTHLKFNLCWWVSVAEDNHTVRIEVSDPYTKELLYMAVQPWWKATSAVGAMEDVKAALSAALLAMWGEEPF